MTHDEELYQQYAARELKDDDTFQFECSMCSDCCRRLAEPVIVNGPDLFRIAKALQLSPAEAAQKYTVWNFGESSHLPVLTLRKWLDGSCRLLRKGRCTVQQDKPAVCALFPLGRMYDPKEDRLRYFKNIFCNRAKRGTEAKTWTLKEWLDEFGLRETEEDTRIWSRMMGGLGMVTVHMDVAEIDGLLLRLLFGGCYFLYDTTKPYPPQVEANMEMLKEVLPEIVPIPKEIRLFES